MSVVREAVKIAQKVGRRAARVIRRGVIQAVSSAYFVQLRGHGAETFEDAELWQQYGFASRPPAGSECLVVLIDADGAKPIVVSTQFRAERPDALEVGDSMVYCLTGNKAGLGGFAERAVLGETLKTQLDDFKTAMAAVAVVGSSAAAITAIKAAAAGIDTSGILTLKAHVE